MDVLLAFIHFIHASIPFFCCSGVEFFIIFSNSAPEAIQTPIIFFRGSPGARRETDCPPAARPGDGNVSLPESALLGESIAPISWQQRSETAGLAPSSAADSPTLAES